MECGKPILFFETIVNQHTFGCGKKETLLETRHLCYLDESEVWGHRASRELCTKI